MKNKYLIIGLGIAIVLLMVLTPSDMYICYNCENLYSSYPEIFQEPQNWFQKFLDKFL